MVARKSVDREMLQRLLDDLHDELMDRIYKRWWIETQSHDEAYEAAKGYAFPLDVEWQTTTAIVRRNDGKDKPLYVTGSETEDEIRISLRAMV